MFERAYLEELGGGRLRHEEQLIQSECQRLEIPVTLYTVKRIHRRQLPLTTDTFISGDMDAMHGAMRQLGIDIPEPLDYPDVLQPYLKRRVWKARLNEVEDALEQGNLDSIFIKPANRQKLFTGQVVNEARDLQRISGVTRQEEIWCSEVVQWKSEYRVYVVRNAVVFIDCYAGNTQITLDRSVVHAAVLKYAESKDAPAGYAMDFGVLKSGETAIVEVNDGYALGAYKIDAKNYSDLIFSRWEELLKKNKIKPVDGIF